MNHSRVIARLLAALDSAPVSGMVDAAYEILAAEIGLKRLWLYLSDFGDTELIPVLTRVAASPTRSLSVAEDVAGAAYRTCTALVEDGSEGPVLWMPVQRRREPLGVLGLGADEIGDGLKEIAGPLASILGAAVLESERYSDTLQIVRGARQMELAAALQWSILPLPSYADGTVEISGRLEPAYDIGGDAFDLGVNEGQVELAIFDAMGHGLQAALLSHLAVGAYRFARRRRGDLAQIASEADQAVSVFGGGERFVTSTMCRISIPNGVLQWINAGHPPPMLVRGGAAESLDGQPMLPLGLGGSPTPVGQMSLEPGDVVVLHSDGIIEARSAHGESYGIQRFVETKLGHLAADPNLTNLTRRVLDAVLEHVGRDLQDDATLVAMRWMGPPGTA